MKISITKTEIKKALNWQVNSKLGKTLKAVKGSLSVIIKPELVANMDSIYFCTERLAFFVTHNKEEYQLKAYFNGKSEELNLHVNMPILRKLISEGKVYAKKLFSVDCNKETKFTKLDSDFELIKPEYNNTRFSARENEGLRFSFARSAFYEIKI